MTKKEKLGWGVCGALGIAVLSFFMDYMSYSGYGMSVGVTGFDVLESALDYMEGNAFMMIIAAVATVAALGIAVMGNLKGNVGLIPAVLSVVSAICMFMVFSEDGAMDYVAMGFWLFMLGHAASVVLSFMAKNANE